MINPNKLTVLATVSRSPARRRGDGWLESLSFARIERKCRERGRGSRLWLVWRVLGTGVTWVARRERKGRIG